MDAGELIKSTVVLFVIGGAVLIFGVFAMIARFYRKVPQGKVLVRNGMGGSKVSFSGMLVLPILHKIEIMDISVKRVEIERTEKDGLVCMDNLRADIKVAFFVRSEEHTSELQSR